MPKAPRTHYNKYASADPYPSTNNAHAMATLNSAGPRPVVPTDPTPATTISPAAERPSTAWTAEDDARLMQCRAKGMNWQPIAGHFHGKTANACRKRHERLMERRNAESWDGARVEDLARAYLESREDMWKLVANRVGEKWQTVEQKVRFPIP